MAVFEHHEHDTKEDKRNPLGEKNLFPQYPDTEQLTKDGVSLYDRKKIYEYMLHKRVHYLMRDKFGDAETYLQYCEELKDKERSPPKVVEKQVKVIEDFEVSKLE